MTSLIRASLLNTTLRIQYHPARFGLTFFGNAPSSIQTWHLRIYLYLNLKDDDLNININNSNNNKIIDNDNINNNEILTEDKVENWSVDEMEKFLLTFIPTEEETSWLKTATKNIPGETDSEVLPYFKAIVKKRLVSGSGCLGPE